MWRIYKKIWLKQVIKYIVPVFIVVCHCFLFQKKVVSYGAIMNQSYDLSIGDYIMAFFWGTEPYNKNNGEVFNVPALLSLYCIYYFMLIAWSAGHISDGYNKQILQRCITRKAWWRQRSIEMCIETGSYIVASMVGFFAYAAMTGSEMEIFHIELQWGCHGMDSYALQGSLREEIFQLGWQWFLGATLFSTFIVFISLAYIQYVISLKENVVVGFILLVVILIASIYYSHPLLIINFIMLIRQNPITDSGLQLWVGVIESIIIIFLMNILGGRVADKKDFF